jgi:hypothetical protein
MSKNRTNGPFVLCWVSGLVLIAVLLAAMFARSDLKVLTETAAEINSVAAVLDSPSGLRSLLISFSNQCSLAQERWLGALDMSLWLITLACMTGFILLVTLALQLRINRQLNKRVRQLQQVIS